MGKEKDKEEPEEMDPAEATSEQLTARETQLLQQIKDGIEEAKKGAPDEAKITALEDQKNELMTVRGEIDKREKQAAEYATKLDELGADLEPAAEEKAEEEEPEKKVEEVAAAPAPVAPVAPAEVASQPIAASSTPPARPKIKVPSAVDLAIPDGTPKIQEAERLVVLASADNGLAPSGSPYQSFGQLGKAFAAKAEALARSRRYGSAPIRADLAQIKGHWPADRLLGDSPSANGDIVSRVLEEFMAMDVVTASGCAIAMPYYGVNALGDRGTPVIDSLPQFGVSGERGAVSLEQPPTITQLLAAGSNNEIDGVGDWTSTEDDDPEAEKGELVIDCGTPVTFDLEATYFRTLVQNFVKLANSERFQAIYDLGLSRFDRRRESKALKQMQTATTVKGVTIPTYLSVFRDTINGLSKEMEHVRSYFRLAPDFRFQWWAPRYLFTAMVEDVRNQMPGDNTVNRAQEVVRDAFAELALSTEWYWDEPLGTATPQISSLQDANNPVRAWRDTAQTILAPAGSFYYIGGETLNFGTDIRDSALNRRNQVASFYELSELVIFNGSFAAEILVDVCTRGAAASLEDVDCVGGS